MRHRQSKLDHKRGVTHRKPIRLLFINLLVVESWLAMHFVGHVQQRKCLEPS